MTPQLNNSWLVHLQDEFNQSYMQELKAFLQAEKQAKKTIYPPGNLIFNALNSAPLNDIKVVILGQDPYHGMGQAHGLSFSVPEGVKPPPSLVNIFKEIKSDLGINNSTGNLTNWAKQGVLLLNSVLTVEQGKAASHQGQGWEQFTDKIIETVNQHCKHVVFMLWGAYAQKKGAHIDAVKHCVLEAPHPSPLSAYRGFLGSGHFSKCNTSLIKHGLKPVCWQLLK